MHLSQETAKFEQAFTNIEMNNLSGPGSFHIYFEEQEMLHQENLVRNQG